MRPVYGWWFSKSCKLPYGDGRPVQVGITHTVEPPLELCRRGLHLSVNPLDALGYARGLIVWRVKASGEIITGNNKLVCSERTYVAGGIDVSGVLQKFIRLCVLDAKCLWDAPDVLIRYLRTGNKSLQEDALKAAIDAVIKNTGFGTPASITKVAANAVARGTDIRWIATYVAETSATLIARACSIDDVRFPWEAYVEVRAAQNRRLTRMLREAIRKRV